jgi:hypothetical protein
MIYWLIGQDFVLNSIYHFSYTMLWSILDNINYSMYQVRNTPLCARTGGCPLDLEVVLAYEKLPELTPTFVIMTWLTVIVVLPKAIGWIMTEPEGRKKTQGP